MTNHFIPPAKSERCFTVASLAERWDCSEGMIRKLIASGELHCFRPGNLIRIKPEEVARFECQNTPCNDSSAASPSSIETPPETGTESDYEPRIVLGQKRRLGADGPPTLNVLPGRWGG